MSAGEPTADRTILPRRPAAQPLAGRCCSLLVVALALLLAPFAASRRARRWRWRPRCWSSSLLVASYDLLLGYTGIVSASRTRCSSASGPTAWPSPARGWARTGRGGWGRRGAAAVAASLALADRPASACGCEAIFFAMITLAVATAFQTLASQLSRVHRRRGRADLQACRLRWRPPSSLVDEPFLGVRIDGQLVTYYLLFAAAAAAVPGAAAHRELALRPRAAGHPRERVPRRGARLSHRGLPHARPTSWPPLFADAAPARCWRCGCATPARTPRCPSRSCSTSC
jgi:hypothetical protein